MEPGQEGIRNVLRTKLVAPQPPLVTVRRPRLFEALDAGVERPLTLVAAPAGWGKTALVTSWLAEGPPRRETAWVSLGKDDDNRRSFWTAVFAALRPFVDDERPLRVPPRARIESVLPHLLEALAGDGEPIVLVLDDFHAVGDPAVMSDLQQLLDYPCERLRVVLLARADPPLRLQRLRVDGRLAEIRSADLAFTPAETRELGRGLELEVDDDDLDLLCERTEGWPAGLRLAARSLEHDPDPHAFITGFAGTDAAVSDYLTSEVISRQDAGTREFLLRTSIANQVSGSLADALTEGPGGSDVLASLVQRDGFISALDTTGGWYRYHPMFAEVLRIELARALPEEVAGLHRRAAVWHNECGMPAEALDHAVRSNDWDLCAAIVGEHWLGLVVRGDGWRLRAALDHIPGDAILAAPELALAAAGLRLDAGQNAVDPLLDAAAAHAGDLSPQRRKRFDVAAAATRLYRARIGGDLNEALLAARAVLDEEWEAAVSKDVRALTLGSLGLAEYWAGDQDTAHRHLQESAGLARECDNDYLYLAAQGWAAAASLGTERFGEARRRAQGAIEVAELRGWTEAPAAGAAFYTLATLALLANDHARAAETLARAKAAVAAPEPLLHLGLAELEATLLAMNGELLTALDLVRSATSDATVPVPRFLRVSAGLLEADLQLALGETGAARKRLAELAEVEGAPDAAVGLARIELAAGSPEAAIAAVATFLADERDPIGLTARLDAWVLDAIARDELRDEEAALRALERSLDLAEPRGLVWPLVRGGPPIRSLLRRIIRRGTAHRALAGDVLAALEGSGTVIHYDTGPLLEPLTDRELTVLRFLPTMMSNTEIASEMFVSVNTVKTHLKHVYRKLDVTDRRDAVRRGRELRLLNPGLVEVTRGG